MYTFRQTNEPSEPLRRIRGKLSPDLHVIDRLDSRMDAEGVLGTARVANGNLLWFEVGKGEQAAILALVASMISSD